MVGGAGVVHRTSMRRQALAERAKGAVAAHTALVEQRRQAHSQGRRWLRRGEPGRGGARGGALGGWRVHRAARRPGRCGAQPGPRLDRNRAEPAGGALLPEAGPARLRAALLQPQSPAGRSGTARSASLAPRSSLTAHRPPLPRPRRPAVALAGPEGRDDPPDNGRGRRLVLPRGGNHRCLGRSGYPRGDWWVSSGSRAVSTPKKTRAAARPAAHVPPAAAAPQ